MENKELEAWLKKTKAKNLSYEELVDYIASNKSCSIDIYTQLEKLTKGRMGKECAQILFNQWQKEKEFSPKRGDRVLVWEGNDDPIERIFLAEIKGLREPIVVVNGGYEEEFKNNMPFESSQFMHMSPLPPEQPSETDFKSQVIELIEKRIEHYKQCELDHLQNGDDHDAIEYRAIESEFKDFLRQIKNLC